CRDRHQGIAARGAYRDRLDNLAGIDAERPRLVDRGVGLPVRDGLERDTMGFEILRYPRHHPNPLSPGGIEHNAATPSRPMAVTRPPRGADGRADQFARTGAPQLSRQPAPV